MTTANSAIHATAGPPFYLTRRWETSAQVAIGGLSVSFFLSFVQYCLQRSDVVRLVPIVLTIATAMLLLLMSAREKRRKLLMDAFRPATLMFLVAACVPALGMSLYRPGYFPFEYGLALIGSLFAIRILLSEIGLEGLVLSFFYGTSAGLLVVVGLTFTTLLASLGAKRYAPLFYDPNRIAYFAATAIPAQLWFAQRERGRKFVLLLPVLCLIVMAAASSRGSIGALAIGAPVAAALYFGRRIGGRSFAVSKDTLIGLFALLFLLTIAGAVFPSSLERVGSYLSTKLELGGRARGLDSGFTGRTRNWSFVLSALPKTSWILGNGYRTSENDFTFSVDSGYLTTVYELGAIATAIILLKYSLVLYQLSRGYLFAKPASGAVLVALVFILVVFFSNGFVHRVFFGDGDPTSIVALFAFVSTRQDVIEEIQSSFLNSSSFQYTTGVR
jgi:hypothetical protein